MIIQLLDTIQYYVGLLNAWITTALHGNAIVAGAVTASIIGSLFFILRKLPKQLWNRVKRHVLFTYNMEFGRRNSSSMINAIAGKFEYELQKHVSNKRSSARIVTRHKRLTESLSNGSFFFRYQGTWVYISRHEGKDKNVASNNNMGNVESNPTSITLSMTVLRFNRHKVMAMLNESSKEYSVPGIYQLVSPSYSSDIPDARRVRNFTHLPTLAIDVSIKKQIDDAIDLFKAQRQYNNAHDIPHKLTFMLYGEPGTGKSTIGEYIAFRFNTSLFCANAASIKAHRELDLAECIESARENILDDEVPVVMFDDLDTIWNGLNKRKKREANTEASPINNLMDYESPILGKLLTALQSPVEINDCVAIFTTNHLEKIDPAIYRPGRITVLLEIGRMSPSSVIQYYQLQYGQLWPEHTPIERSLRACDVSSYYSSNRQYPEGFINAVISNELSADETFKAQQLIDS